MTKGKLLYSEQADNLSGTAVYRMHIAEASADRLVFDVENVSSMRYFFVTLFHPGECSRSTFWIANPTTSGDTTTSRAQDGTRAG